MKNSVVSVVILAAALFSIAMLTTANASDIIYQQLPDGSMPGAAYYNNYGDTSGIILDGSAFMFLTAMGSDWLNEVVVTVDLTGYAVGQLDFEQFTGIEETPESLPASFSGHYNGDGVAVSTDGTNWTTIVNASQLDDWPLSVALPGGSSLQVKFQQFNPYPQDYLNFEGRAIGAVVITGSTTAAAVPNVVGMIQSTAQSEIETAGLTTGIISTAYSSSVPAGIVISQSPAAGSIVGTGSAINLTVSLGALYYSGGTGTADDPYKIASIEDLQELSGKPADWDKSFILTADIALFQTFTQSPIAPHTNDWYSPGTPFTGIFDGNNHIISYLTIAASTKDYVGLFGYIGTGGQVRNLGVKNVNITGRSDVGGLAGYNYHGTISNCYVTGAVSVTDGGIGGLTGYNDDGGVLSNCYATCSTSGYLTMGGLVGINHGTLTNCHATGAVTGFGYVGGLAGRNYGTLTNCYATGPIDGAGRYIGGLVGDNDGTLTNCHATGPVRGQDLYIGGLVGYNTNAAITSCYATGSVSGEWQDWFVGGLVGSNYRGTVTACYATGDVSGTTGVGGLIGDNGGSIVSCYATGPVTATAATGETVGGLAGYNGGSLTACFWDVNTSNQPVGIGYGTSTGATGKTTVEMKTKITFSNTGWDFSTPVWKMCDGTNYPRLAWEQNIAGDLVCPDGVTFGDYTYIVQQWLDSNCHVDNNCGNRDLDHSGTVDVKDIATVAQHWLEGTKQ